MQCMNPKKTLLIKHLQSVIYLSEAKSSILIYTHNSHPVELSDSKLTYTDLFTGLRNTIMLRDVRNISIDDLKAKHTTLLPSQYKNLFNTNIISTIKGY